MGITLKSYKFLLTLSVYTFVQGTTQFLNATPNHKLFTSPFCNILVEKTLECLTIYNILTQRTCNKDHHIVATRGVGGGGGSLPLEAVPDAPERKKRVKMVSKSGVGAEREKGVKNAKN